MAMPRAGSRNEKAMAMHFQRLVGALVGSAFGAGQPLSQKATEARGLTTKIVRRCRDGDPGGVAGFDGKARRALAFAAEMGMQAFAQLAAATGTVQAYRAITGEEWKAYVAPLADPRRSSARPPAPNSAPSGAEPGAGVARSPPFPMRRADQVGTGGAGHGPGARS